MNGVKQHPMLDIRDGDKLLPQRIVRELYEATHGDAIVVTGVGQHQMWAAQHYFFNNPDSFISSGGLGTMGFGLPAAMGAKVGRPEKMVWLIDGDGSFQMTIQELATLVQDNIAVKIAIINNGYLGMVRQWQDLFYKKNYVATPLSCPDFVKVAEAYCIAGLKVTKREEIRPAIEKAMAHDGPFLINFMVEPEENVYPDGAARRFQYRIYRPAEERGVHMATTKHTLVAIVQDKPGVLNRMVSLFRRRGFNIDSIAVGHSEVPHLSRVTIIVNGTTAMVEQVRKHLDKLIDVVKVSDITGEKITGRELALVKVKATSATRSEILEIADIFRANIVDVASDSLTIEITGDEDKIESMLKLLHAFGVKEIARTGRVAMVRGTLGVPPPEGKFIRTRVKKQA